MGHYSLIRGWIHFTSAGFGEEEYWKEYKDYRELVDALQNWITVSNLKYDEYIKESFSLQEGKDDTLFLFVGTSVKDYGKGIECFIQDTIKKFPLCRGLICFNEADHEIYPPEKIWFIKEGKIFESRVSSLDGLRRLLKGFRVVFILQSWIQLKYYKIRYSIHKAVAYLRRI